MTGADNDMPVLGQGEPPSLPSIFNDVIGPVMRGPSSSHCAAAVRIGRLARDLMEGRLEEVLVEFHADGSLATTHETQGSDMGLFGGLLGWEASDPRLVDSPRAIREAGIRVEIRISEFPAFHPNTYRLTLRGGGSTHGMTALSTGGGIIRVVELDGISLVMEGDLHETLVFLGEAAAGPEWAEAEGRRGAEALLEHLEQELKAEEVILHGSPEKRLLRIRSRSFPDGELLRRLTMGWPVREVRRLAPVLPIQSGRGMSVPFLRARELLGVLHQDKREGQGPALSELAIRYESARGGIGEKEVLGRMVELVGQMADSVEEGLAGTEYADRILPAQAPAYREALEAGTLLDAGILNRMILYATALMEVKSAMGVVVAAPTAGSCGALPGAVLGAGHAMGKTREEMALAMLAAGLVGVFIAAGSTFAAEECGCQAECGAGSGMAAAALVTLAGGSGRKSLSAASMALQNTLGLICDPVANRVEVPCLGRNTLALGNALASANMALAGFDPVLPLDEVIETMDRVGKALPRELRCTALGGLSVTETARAVQHRLESAGREEAGGAPGLS